MIFKTGELRKFGVKDEAIYLEWLNLYMLQFNINTPYRVICFLANLLQETGNFKYIEELASGDLYDTRIDLGNTPQIDGDGRKYKGKGLAQLTGKKHYKLFTEWCKLKLGINIDFVKYPERLKEPQFAVLSAIYFWNTSNLEKYADKNDFKSVCAIWNTGRASTPENKINGWEHRKLNYNKMLDWFLKILNENGKN
jgi:putative chitinase